MTRWVSHHQNFIMIIYNLCQTKTPKLNFRIKWFAGIKLISKVSVYNFDLSALNETSDQWQILDPDVEDSHILPLGTLFKVSLCQSLSENSSYFRPSLNSKLILISKLILVLLGGLLKKQKTEFGFQMQLILDVSEWLQMDANIGKVRKHKSKIWASGTGSNWSNIVIKWIVSACNHRWKFQLETQLKARKKLFSNFLHLLILMYSFLLVKFIYAKINIVLCLLEVRYIKLSDRFATTIQTRSCIPD